jgi:hypothetical protein
MVSQVDVYLISYRVNKLKGKVLEISSKDLKNNKQPQFKLAEELVQMEIKAKLEAKPSSL